MKVDFLNLQDSRTRYLVAAIALTLASIAAAFAPTLVGADQLTARSIALSNSSAAAENVEYSVNFTAAAAAEAVVIDFCSNTPLLGETCTNPTGLTLTGAASVGSTNVVADNANGDITIDRAITAGANNFSITGITNPTAAATMYARIMTYAAAADADTYTSTTPGNVLDNGSVALAITNTIGVSGAVLETLTFCVANTLDAEDAPTPIAANCADANDEGNEPVLTLGEEVGVGSGVFALTPGQVSVGVLHTQITTNAAGGAVVRLKSDATGCGGLMRLGSDAIASRCIEPAMAQLVDGSAEFFGVKTNSASAAGTFGVLAPVTGYDNVTYNLNYAANNETGVTSVLGDEFLSTNNAPVDNANMGITFGAAATNQTPAGMYAADLRLIATGTF